MMATAPNPHLMRVRRVSSTVVFFLITCTMSVSFWDLFLLVSHGHR